ncbi:MAG: glycosyltransferase family 9 protein [bacterium]|nr:glycosyltransferase family 9 protein [bacterium]
MRWTIIQTAFLGDVVLTLPLLEEIQSRWQGSELQFICRPEAASVIETAPGIIDVAVYDKRGKQAGLSGWLTICNRIRNFQPELVLCPHRSVRSVLLAGCSSARERIGYDRAVRVPGFTKRVKYRKDVHETARLLDLLTPLTNVLGVPRIPNIHLTDADRARADAMIPAGSGKWVAIAPGAVWHTKKYPTDRYARVAALLSQQGYRIVTIGGPDDKQLCEQVASAGKGIACGGLLSPRESAAVLAKCAALLTNDSAPLHLGQAVGTPTIAIFGATVPGFGFGPQAPFDEVIGIELSCRPCAIHGGNQCPMKHFRCMLNLAPEQVATIVDQTIQRTSVLR